MSGVDMSAEVTVAVIGAGPAGLLLADLLADSHRVSLFDRLAPGGELLSLGLVNGPDGVESPGPDVATDMLERVMERGVQIEFDEVSEIRAQDGNWRVVSDGGEQDYDYVVLATGAEHGGAPIPGAAEMLGRGVSYCTGCDSPMFAGRTVALVGGGPYMSSDAQTLAAYAATVHVVGGLRDSDPVPGVEQHPSATPQSLVTDDAQGVVGLRIDDGGSPRTLPVEGVFVSAPTVPRSELVADLVDLAPDGGVLVGDNLQSSSAGLFVVGDVRDGRSGGVAGALRDSQVVARAITTARHSQPMN